MKKNIDILLKIWNPIHNFCNTIQKCICIAGRLVCEKDYIQELLNPEFESKDDIIKG